MNQKHAREARIINRSIGHLAKKQDLPVNAETGVTILGAGPGKSHKLPRAVKRGLDKMSHRVRGKVTREWRGAVARSLLARGITPKGNRKLHEALVSSSKLPRRVRRAIQRAYKAAEQQA